MKAPTPDITNTAAAAGAGEAAKLLQQAVTAIDGGVPGFDPSPIGKTKPSCCHLTLFVALKGDTRELNLPASNFWIAPHGPDHNAATERYYAPTNVRSVCI